MMKTVRDHLTALGIITFILAVIFGFYLHSQGWTLESIQVSGGPVSLQFDPPPTATAISFVFDMGTALSPLPIELSSPTPAILMPPTDVPSIYLGEWIIVIGQFPSLDSARNYIVPFIKNGYTVQIFCRISPSDTTQTPELRAAVVGFSSEDSANNALPHIQTLNNAAYLRQSSVWCPNPVSQANYVSCNYESCK